MQLRYMYSMSVERITSLFNDHGFDVTKSTLNGLLSKTAGLMEKMAEYGITWAEIDAALANEEF